MTTITDKIEALKAVKQNGRVLDYVCVELQNDRDVVLEAIKS
jgi:hypothetical protein